MSSSSTGPAAYHHDDIGSDRDGRFVLRNDVMGVLLPDKRSGYKTWGEEGDALHIKLKEEQPSLAEVYKTVVEHYKTWGDASFWLRFPRPTEEEATRLLERSTQGLGLEAGIYQTLHSCDSDYGLVLSCVSLSTSDGELSDENDHLAKHKLTPEAIRELRLIHLLREAGADTGSLVSLHKGLYGKYPIIMDFENRVPLPHIVLPSKLSTLNKAQVPRAFEVKWPTDNQVIRSSGITDFFRDFYAMSVQRPYQQPPGFEFIKVLVKPDGVLSNSSQPKCLIICSSYHRVQQPLHDALLRVRAKQVVRDSSSLNSWSPLHDLLDCISVVYQMMFQNMENFVRERLLILQAITFHGRDHPWQSKFQYLYILEDQIAIAQDALAIALEALEEWLNAEINGVMLASLPGAEWPLRIERLKKDASYLISCFDVLIQHQDKLKSMLKERLDLNSGTRSLIIAIFASIYIPLAFISSYFGMNASGFTDGGLTSTNTFWKVSIPLVIASIIVPIAFSGLLIRKAMQIAFIVYARVQQLLWQFFSILGWIIVLLGFCSSGILRGAKWLVCGWDPDEHDGEPRRPGCIILPLWIINDLRELCTEEGSSSDDNEGVSNQALEMA